ncbi:MAG: tRNA (adenosine(37)-N6)-threonylcarbamoyltransferase complex transferase subunit TsaD, partial [Actinomycetota bacterium]|nr:tRNA (adenosine(37)-N6)-threonylcarbamoyltransferase complex transferase subunit TsaD [Actinomycetota bacterium]
DASFPRPWTRGMFAQDLERDDRMWLAADCDGVVQGYAGAVYHAAEAHVLNLAVAPDSRCRGLGTILLSELLDVLRARDVHAVTLEVREGNAAAIALYESAGFHAVGHRPGYYAETGESALVMWSDELDSPGAEARLDALAAKARDALKRLSSESDTTSGSGAGEEPLVLGIETSCDETAAAVMIGGSTLLSSVVASQVDFHARFGGVVPEIASRKHTEAVVPVVEEAMQRASENAGRAIGFSDLDAIAVTYGPGLVGALVVGLAYAKGLSFATGVPLVGVNHLEGHIFAAALDDPTVAPPLIALVVSGGHTSLVHVPEWGVYRTLGATLDDAAGEAFDKVAKVLGLGYPGGPVISRLAAEGDATAIDFPRAMLHSGDYRFSLSGLKTAVINHIRREREAGHEIDLPDLAASFQAAVIDVQVAKAVRAAEEYSVRSFVLAGGVAANPALRAALTEALGRNGVKVTVPGFELCTDNAAMIAAAGTFRFLSGERLPLTADAVPDLKLDAD